MYSLKDRKRAVELYIKYDRCAADVRLELGYPSKKMLKVWYKEYMYTGTLHESYRGGPEYYTRSQKQNAVDYYLEHGKSLSRTVKAMGYPSKQALRTWIDELAPTQREICVGRTKQGKTGASYKQKKRAVVDLISRKGAAGKVAEGHGVKRVTLYQWKYELLGKEKMPVRPDCDISLPDDPESLLKRIEELRDMNKGLELESFRLKMEMFYYRSWKGVSIDEFISILNGYLHWYNSKRIKKSLGFKSPMDYRRSLGLAA
jgi:transposase-like protein